MSNDYTEIKQDRNIFCSYRSHIKKHGSPAVRQLKLRYNPDLRRTNSGLGLQGGGRQFTEIEEEQMFGKQIFAMHFQYEKSSR